MNAVGGTYTLMTAARIVAEIVGIALGVLLFILFWTLSGRWWREGDACLFFRALGCAAWGSGLVPLIFEIGRKLATGDHNLTLVSPLLIGVWGLGFLSIVGVYRCEQRRKLSAVPAIVMDKIEVRWGRDAMVSLRDELREQGLRVLSSLSSDGRER